MFLLNFVQKYFTELHYCKCWLKLAGGGGTEISATERHSCCCLLPAVAAVTGRLNLVCTACDRIIVNSGTPLSGVLVSRAFARWLVAGPVSHTSLGSTKTVYILVIWPPSWAVLTATTGWPGLIPGLLTHSLISKLLLKIVTDIQVTPWWFITPPGLGRGGRYCYERVCMSVCLSAGMSLKSLKPHVQSSSDFLHTLLGPCLVMFSSIMGRVVRGVSSINVGAMLKQIV